MVNTVIGNPAIFERYRATGGGVECAVEMAKPKSVRLYKQAGS